MASTAPKTLTQLLLASSHGDQTALDAAMPLVYDELRRLARSYMRRERPGHTLQTTVLVHEAYLRLLGQDANWVNRSHFFGIAAKMMRRILLDHAKSHRRAKRGGGAVKVTLDEPALFSKSPDMDLVAVDEALRRLEEIDHYGVSNLLVLKHIFPELTVFEVMARKIRACGCGQVLVRDWDRKAENACHNCQAVVTAGSVPAIGASQP